MFGVAQAALTNHPELQSVVIMQHPPRYDSPDVDPIGIKPQLAQYANSTFHQMWQSSAMKDRLTLGVHSLSCPDDVLTARYRDENSGRYDGVHMYGRQGMKAFSSSVILILKSFLTPANKTATNDDHSSCPQTKHMNDKKKTTKPEYQTNQTNYTIPVRNKFDILGN